jgi:hypothetical protein
LSWRRRYEDFGNTEDGYASDEEVESGLFDSGDDYDIVATGRAAERLTGVGRVALGRVQRESAKRRVFNGNGHNPKAYSNSRDKDSGKRGVKESEPSNDILIQEEFNFPGMLREGWV